MWWEALIPGGAIIVSWVLIARIFVAQNKRMNDIDKRTAYLEGKVNGKND